MLGSLGVSDPLPIKSLGKNLNSAIGKVWESPLKLPNSQTLNVEEIMITNDEIMKMIETKKAINRQAAISEAIALWTDLVARVPIGSLRSEDWQALYAGVVSVWCAQRLES